MATSSSWRVGYQTWPITIFCDSKTTIHIAANLVSINIWSMLSLIAPVCNVVRDKILLSHLLGSQHRLPFPPPASCWALAHSTLGRRLGLSLPLAPPPMSSSHSASRTRPPSRDSVFWPGNPSIMNHATSLDSFHEPLRNLWVVP